MFSNRFVKPANTRFQLADRHNYTFMWPQSKQQQQKDALCGDIDAFWTITESSSTKSPKRYPNLVEYKVSFNFYFLNSSNFWVYALETELKKLDANNKSILWSQWNVFKINFLIEPYWPSRQQWDYFATICLRKRYFWCFRFIIVTFWYSDRYACYVPDSHTSILDS